MSFVPSSECFCSPTSPDDRTHTRVCLFFISNRGPAGARPPLMLHSPAAHNDCKYSRWRVVKVGWGGVVVWDDSSAAGRTAHTNGFHSE